MLKNTTPAADITIGLDLGDKTAQSYAMNGDGEWVDSRTIRMTRESFRRAFTEYPGATVAIETGGQSAWVEEILEARGFEVIVANSRRLHLISRNNNKSDESDAELLCRTARVDPELLAPIEHRGVDIRRDRALLRSRETLIGSRTALINSVRGQVKSFGHRIRRCSAAAFPKRARETVPEDLFPGLQELLDMITELTAQIKALDAEVDAACKRHVATELLRQVPGVGPLTSLAFVLAIEDPSRFEQSRAVGPFFGLTPSQRQSGERDPDLGITKAGDPMVRRLLVSAARYIMRKDSPDTDLKRFGKRLSGRGTTGERNRAAVAVARKLAVLLHRLWVTGEVYVPLGYHEQSAELAA